MALVTKIKKIMHMNKDKKGCGRLLPLFVSQVCQGLTAAPTRTGSAAKPWSELKGQGKSLEPEQAIQKVFQPSNPFG